MGDFTNPTGYPRRRADPVQDFRDHDGEVNDEIDAARDREAESGRDPRARSNFWLGYLACLLVALCVVVALWLGK